MRTKRCDVYENGDNQENKTCTIWKFWTKRPQL